MAEGNPVPKGYLDTVCKHGKPDGCVYSFIDYSEIGDEVRCMKGDPQTERIIAGIAKFHADKGAPQVNCSGTPEFTPKIT